MMLGSVMFGALFGMGTSVVYLLTGGSFLNALLVYMLVGAAAVVLLPCALLVIGAIRSRTGRSRGNGFARGFQRE